MSTRFETTARYAPLARRRSGALTLLVALYATWQQRKVLSELEPHLLDDIGVTKNMADREANRPVWDIPSHWLR